MKYLKLFEAFESVKLTKILGYINSKSKNDFINDLEKLARSYDFPMSKFSDDMFQYLPFKKALNVHYKKEQQDCKADSKRVFGSSGISGETCRAGRIKRHWGSGVRNVECPACEGTGKEPMTGDLKLIKYWFTSEGQFVAKTGVDGIIREGKKSISKLASNYTIEKEISSSDYAGVRSIRDLANLTPVLIKVKSRGDEIFGIIYQSSGESFCIQNEYDGGTPNGSNWQNYGRYSWNISGGDFYTIKVLKPKKKDKEEGDKVDPYTWNVSLDRNLRVSERGNVEDEIKDAHFALVLDISKLKSGDYVRKSDISDERAELKSGSRLTMTDDDIRKANIQRYIQEIAKRSDVTQDIGNTKKFVNRAIGGRWVLFITESQSRFYSRITSISEYYYNLMKTDEDNKEYYIEQINRKVEDIYQNTGTNVNVITKNLEEIKKRLKSEGSDVEDKYLPIVEGLEKISTALYNRIMSGHFDSIEDLEIVRQKLMSVSNIMSNSIYGLDNLSNFIDYLIYDNSDRPYSYLVGTWRVDDYYDKIIDGLSKVLKIIERL